ncbi:exodeoxyribonuclease V subunit beta [Kingella kingae]|uniref:exodeoxyribonuclease V subunit beta n=1 Tax=Kingella kingae TaxID=504 RepID=UPI002555593C|nr:exodeoxyribonuclease V subunit beta [Kingella kingae]MDK4652324.1 exodeoxyribonuclease V subunit beta [Kingella kingae]
MSHDFTPLNVPLVATNLIEASAGTGKTWNISALFARLVLLEQMPVDKILVVTFTNAATAELKTRLRDRLGEALHVLHKMQAPFGATEVQAACEQYAPKSADFMSKLVEQALQKESRERLMMRLKAALSQFDHAAIYTIHSFCQRVLQDFAFYCQVPFQIELDEDSTPSPIAAQDFWREQVAHHEQLAQIVYRHQKNPQQQAAALASFVGRTYLHTRPTAYTLRDWQAANEGFVRAWQDTANQLDAIESAWEKLQPSLPKNSYQPDDLKSYIQQCYDWKSAGCLPDVNIILKLFFNSKNENKFSLATLTDKAKKDFKGKQDPDALDCLSRTWGEWANHAQILSASEGDVLINVAMDLLHAIRQQNEADKQKQPARQFDDLLLDVFNALQTNRTHATALAQAMSRTWQVVLIDEFQDTDPLQYGIFSRAFMQSSLHTENAPTVFMVGDPKQAIYNFRGADIFAYLQAAENVSPEQRYTLRTNFRSHARLVNSVGALFAKPQPFVLPNLAYETVQAHRSNSHLSPQEAAVRVRWLNDLSLDKTEKTDALQHTSAQWCASEIAYALHRAGQGELRLKDKPLHAGDMAVLVRTRQEGAMVQRELKRLNVQSVLLSRDSVFQEDEARAVYALLAFFLNPQQTAHLVYVLAGCLFGYTAQQLWALQQDERALSEWADKASVALQKWQKVGVYAAVQHFLQQHDVIQNLLAAGNDRTLTNLGQVLELLAAEEESGRLPAALYQWLQQEIAATQDGDSNENRALRLESDEQLVKIVTMHASKGLQYPIVYCPFVWRGKGNKGDDWQVLQGESGSTLLHKNQMTDADKEQAQKEWLSEDLRLLYVALTRAEEQLVLYLAAHENTHHHPFYYLLDGDAHKTWSGAKVPAHAYRQIWQQFVQKQNAETTSFEWDETPQAALLWTQNGKSSLHIQSDSDTVYQAQTVATRHYAPVVFSSFTALSSHQHAPEALANTDEAERKWDIAVQAALPSETTSLPIQNDDIWDVAHFPRGAKAGVCLHELLEYFPFGQPAEKHSERIVRVLNRHQIADAENWLPAVCDMLDKVRQTPLANGIRLCDLSRQEWLNEMAFLFEIEQFNLVDVQNWCKQMNLSPECVQAALSLTFRQLSGFLNGFIDTLVYTQNQALVIDYKSNYLADYSPASLNPEIAKHHYYLQALIYAIAMARYLRSRQCCPDVIAVRYVFLRGVDGSSQQGVWACDVPVASLAVWL